MGKKKKAKQREPEVVYNITAVNPATFKPLYPHPDTGQAILTNSMLTAFRKCIRQADYKYARRLKPKRLGQPLKRGQWVHELLEVHAKGGDWKKHHKRLSRKFNEMFDEEKDFYGDMPTEILRVMNGYFWHYKRDPWKYHEVELELTAELPNGVLLRIKFDGLIENQWGLWLVDHKSHKTLPNHEYRLLDTQSPLYIWVAHQNDIPVNGFIWNYIKWKAPTIPELVYVGTPRERLSKRVTETDYPTFRKALRDYGLNEDDYAERLAYYKSLRYVPGEPQNSPFYYRSVFEKDDALVDRVLKEAMRTAERMNTYDFSDPDGVERTVGRHCQFACSYTDLCTMELLGGNTRPLLRQNYKEGDPMDYYHDRVGDGNNKEDNE